MRALVRVADAFVLRIVDEFSFRHEVADFQWIVGILGSLDLVELLLGDETTIGQQCLIHGTHLADAQGRVGDALPALGPLTRLGNAHQIDNAQHHAVAERGMFDQRGSFRVEDVRLERRHHEHRIGGFLAGQSPELFVRLRISVEHQIIESTQRVRQIGGITSLIHAATHLFRNISQAVQRIAGTVDVGFHRRIAERRLCFNEQEEQQTVHVSQRLHCQVARVDFVDAPPLVAGPVVDDLVAKYLHAFT